VVFDGVEGPAYDVIVHPPVWFSPDGQGFACLASLRERWRCVLNGGGGPEYDSIVGDRPV